MADALHERFGGVLLDLDGVVRRGRSAIPGAADALAGLRDAGRPFACVTNNALLTPEAVAESLQGLGLPVDADRVVTSPQAVALLLAPQGPKRVLVVGGDGLRRVLADAGHTIVDSADDAPDVVVQGYSPDVGWPQLAEATLAVSRGADWYASNPDPTLPSERGLLPGNGALVAAVRTATGLEPTVAGKPEPAIFRLAAKRLGTDDLLMVGDRMDTDVAGANGAGLASAIVLTGAHGPAEILDAAPASPPGFVLESVDGLLEPYPEVKRTGDGVHVGGATARVADGALVVGASGDWIDRLRAAVAAAEPGVATGDAAAALAQGRPRGGH